MRIDFPNDDHGAEPMFVDKAARGCLMPQQSDREIISRRMYRAVGWERYWPYDAMPKWLWPGWHHNAPTDRLVPDLRVALGLREGDA